MIAGIQPTVESRAAVALRNLADVVHLLVPDKHTIDLHAPEMVLRRGICGEHGRVEPTRQGLCPRCAGYLHDADHVARMRVMARRLAAA